MSDQHALATTTWTCDGLDDLAALRRAVYASALRTEVSAEAVDGFLVAVSEVATNALKHGTPPYCTVMWAATHSLACTVTDGGDGIHGEPTLRPLAADAIPDYGMGLWAVHQLCDRVSYHQSEEGFTVRLQVGG
ncbi:hypothetical protein BH20ACT6_BH20ACT6_18360 [soil metagenome]